MHPELLLLQVTSYKTKMQPEHYFTHLNLFTKKKVNKRKQKTHTHRAAPI